MEIQPVTARVGGRHPCPGAGRVRAPFMPGLRGLGAASRRPGGRFPVIVWVWEASGPTGTFRKLGICLGGEDAARGACEDALGDGAVFASVEMAKFDLAAMSGRYDLTGIGCTASRNPATGEVAWVPFRVREMS